LVVLEHDAVEQLVPSRVELDGFCE
jgi:hypothetical protein